MPMGYAEHMSCSLSLQLNTSQGAIMKCPVTQEYQGTRPRDNSEGKGFSVRFSCIEGSSQPKAPFLWNLHSPISYSQGEASNSFFF